MSLNLEEKELAQILIANKPEGIYELSEIYFPHEMPKPPTVFGKKFKETVQSGGLRNIRVFGKKSNNHHTYQIIH